MYCPFGIFKFIKSGKKQDFRGRIFCLDAAGQFHSVHKRHSDICHHHIRLKFLHHLKGLCPVIGMSYHKKSKSFPIDLPHYDMDHFFFIIHQKY